VAEGSDVMERVAAQVRPALEAADLTAYRDLLDPNVRWGAPGDPSPPCQNRDQVLAWYEGGRDSGTRARVVQTIVHGDRILVGLAVTHGPADGQPPRDRWQVLTVRGGRVVEIVGFDDQSDAAEYAGLAGGTS